MAQLAEFVTRGTELYMVPQAVQWQFLIALICGFAITHWILWPLSKRAQVLRLPKRLALTDLFGLMVLLQVAVGV